LRSRCRIARPRSRSGARPQGEPLVRRVASAEVRHRKLAGFRLVELVEGDIPPLRAPPKAIAQPKLFLVHPVERAVDNGAVAAVRGKRGLRHCIEVDDVEISLAHERYLIARRVELREHLEAGIAVGDGRERLLLQVVDVVIALRIVAPDALGVGVDEHLAFVGAVLIALDLDEPVHILGIQIRAVD